MRAQAFEFIVIQQHVPVRIQGLLRGPGGGQTGFKQGHKGLTAFRAGRTKAQGQQTAAFLAPVLAQHGAGPRLKGLSRPDQGK